MIAESRVGTSVHHAKAADLRNVDLLVCALEESRVRRHHW